MSGVSGRTVMTTSDTAAISRAVASARAPSSTSPLDRRWRPGGDDHVETSPDQVDGHGRPHDAEADDADRHASDRMTGRQARCTSRSLAMAARSAITSGQQADRAPHVSPPLATSRSPAHQDLVHAGLSRQRLELVDIRLHGARRTQRARRPRPGRWRDGIGSCPLGASKSVMWDKPRPMMPPPRTDVSTSTAWARPEPLVAGRLSAPAQWQQGTAECGLRVGRISAPRIDRPTPRNRLARTPGDLDLAQCHDARRHVQEDASPLPIRGSDGDGVRADALDRRPRRPDLGIGVAGRDAHHPGCQRFGYIGPRDAEVAAIANRDRGQATASRLADRPRHRAMADRGPEGVLGISHVSSAVRRVRHDVACAWPSMAPAASRST